MNQQQALDIIQAGYNVFLTGPAGSGKTHVLNKFIQNLRMNNYNIGVTASTGIAGTHLGGVTIHAWSGIGIRDQLTDYDIDNIMQKEILHRRYTTTDVLIIDEISMLHAYQLDMVNYLAQAFRQDLRPFGGMQVVFSGDLFQLPPVSKSGERKLVMESKIWQEMDLKICYLDEQFRQKDNDDLLNILQEIRNNSISKTSEDLLASRLNIDVQDEIEPTKLFTHNADVDRINAEELSKLDTPSRVFQMSKLGHAKLIAGLVKSSPAVEELQLKIGAQVMFIKNDFEHRFVNGTRGVVVDFNSTGSPIIKTLAGKHITVEPMEWAIDDNGRILARISQIPLRLAWAITVHKSQGMSLDTAEIDLSGAFEPGMGYVALSRVRSLEGLILKGINNIALQIHPKIHKFDKVLQEDSLNLLNDIKILLKNPLRTKNAEKAKKAKKPSNRDKTLALLEKGLSLSEIAKKQKFALTTIIGHIEQLVEEGKEIDFDDILPDDDANDEIRNAFDELGTEFLKPVYEYFEGRYPYSYIRLVRAKYFL